MTPKPPPSSDGSSLPPRHRPPLGNLAKDTTEMDLWAFDDTDPLDEVPEDEPVKPARSGIPEPREAAGDVNPGPKPKTAADKGTSPSSSGSGDSVSVNIGMKMRMPISSRGSRTSGGPTGHSAPGADFEDLDSWEEPVPAGPRPNVFKEMPVAVQPSEPEPVEEVIPEVVAPVSEPDDDRAEFSPKYRSDIEQAIIRPKLNLTKIERVGLIALLVLIACGGGLFYFGAIGHLPTGTEMTKETDFPIKGGKFVVNSAVTYWREPVTSGGKIDTVRRDTLLIPEIDLSTSGGSAGMRVFFRDGDGELVGDVVTRTVNGDMKFQVAATAGFDDLGKYAAYRTGQGKPWTIEVLEAPAEDSPTEEFKKLFEMKISTERH